VACPGGCQLIPVKRLRDHRDVVLLFTRNPPVPVTNNIAELDLGMEKVKQRISGCHRSMEGAINRTIIRTVPATARRQCWNMPDTLRKPSPELEAPLEVDLPIQAPGQDLSGLPGNHEPATGEHHHMNHWHRWCHCIGGHYCINCNFIAGVLNSYGLFMNLEKNRYHEKPCCKLGPQESKINLMKEQENGSQSPCL